MKTFEKNSNLDAYWNDFFETFIKAMLTDGYDEFEVLDKMMSVFKSVRSLRNAPEPVAEPTAEEPKEVTTITSEFTPRFRKIDKGTGKRSFSQGTHNNKTLSSKFEHAVVYMLGAENESLATIEVGPTKKVRDVFRLLSTGEELSESEYLIRFNKFINPDASDEWGYRNKARVVFQVNPKANLGTVKHKKWYDKFESIDDIAKYVPQRGRKGGRRRKDESESV